MNPIVYNSEFDSFMAKMCKECFNNHLPVVISGNHRDIFLKSLLFREEPSQSVSLLAIEAPDQLQYYTTKKRLYKSDDYTKVSLPFPTDKFIINEAHISLLDLHIYKIHYSIWWNLYGHFFIKNTESLGSCDDAYSYLRIIWKFDILEATYICYDYVKGIQFYTFNPFTDYAPDMWKIIEVYRQDNGHPFTLFSYTYENGDDIAYICDALIFDKALTLGSYPLKVVAAVVPLLISYDVTQPIFKIRGVEGETIELMWTKLNATLNMTEQPNGIRGMIYADGTADGMIGDVLEGKYDFLLHFRTDEGLWKNQYYINSQMELCIVTPKEALTIFKQISRVINNKNAVIAIICYVFLIISLQYLNKLTFFQAAFDLLRTLLGLPMLYDSSPTKFRMFFIALIYTCMILNTIIQSQCYSAMTVPAYEEFIETEQQLIDLNYKVYASKLIAQYYFPNKPLNGHFIFEETLNDCARKIKVENGIKSACVDFCGLIKYFTVENSTVHISVVKKIDPYLVFISRDDFSLYKRFTTIFYYLQEGGFQTYLIKNQTFFGFIKNNEITKFQPISLHQLSFACVLFTSGLILSSIILLIECRIAFCKEKGQCLR